MDALKSHYRQLLVLDESWIVTSVDLDITDKQVVVRLEHVGNELVCPECRESCSTKDHAPQRCWRHLDTMQFETILESSVPRSNCSKCGVKTIRVPWASKHSRFTVMFEVFAIEVLQAASNVSAAATLLGLSWDSVHAIMERAVARNFDNYRTRILFYCGKLCLKPVT